MNQIIKTKNAKENWREIFSMKSGVKILMGSFLIIASLNASLASEDVKSVIAQAQEIISQRVSCEAISLNQLEILGDYYMEQMHSGELHEIMDERMGGEGSESLRQVHINMGRMFYCGQTNALSSGMMNTMMGRNMMGSYGNYYSINPIYNALNFFLSVLIIVALTLLIFYLIKKIGKKNGKRK